MNVWVVAGDIAMWVVVVSSWGFVFTYGFTAPWYRSEMGWHLMSFAVLIGLVFTWIAVRWFLRAAPPPEPISRFVIYGAVAAMTTWRWSIMLRAQRRGKRKVANADH